MSTTQTPAHSPTPILDARGYITQRLDDQIGWYEGKAASSQRAFKTLRFVEILASATIPLLAGYAKDQPTIQLVIGGLGLAIAVIAGVLALFRFQENWTEYRVTAELLKHEKYLFLTQAAPYGGADALARLVDRVESLISTETNRWAHAMRPATPGQGDGAKPHP